MSQATFLAVCMLATAALPFGLAGRLARRRAPGALEPLLRSHTGRVAPITATLVAIGVWVSAYSLELLIPQYQVSVWMHRIAYLGIALVPPCALLTALEATDRGSWTRGRSLVLLGSLPFVTILLTLTNDFQSLLWAPTAIVQVADLTPIDSIRGPWFWVHTAYSYVCLGAAFALLARHYLHSPRKHALEAGALGIAFIAPWAINAISIFLGVGGALDLTPVGFLATGLILYRLLERHHLVDLLPIARSAVIEVLEDGVLVLDAQDRVLDANTAAHAFLLPTRGSGRHGSQELLSMRPQLAGLLADRERRMGEFTIETGAVSPAHYEVRVAALRAAGWDRSTRVVTIRDITDHRRAASRFLRLAHYDSLTGLPNRLLFNERFEAAIAAAASRNHLVALLYLDLDGFKLVNDSLGHPAGDELLKIVGQRLDEQVRSRDLVARLGEPTARPEVSRLGGDEFALVLSKVRSEEDAGDVAERLLRSIAKPLSVADQTLSISCSIGIALFPFDGEDGETLAKHADTALYHAKDLGRNRYQFFRPALNKAALRRLTVETRLRKAIERNELQLHYQPKISLATGRAVGMEALARWDDPELGSVSPGEFIPIAEKSGLILELGLWALRAACSQLKSWQEEGLGVLPIAVNVASQQFAAGDLLGVVAGVLREFGVEPGLLELELTETTLLADDEQTALTLRDLRSIGIRIALDDFGTGYSALSYLSRFPLDVLKLDRSFVLDVDCDPGAVGVASAVVTMAHSLDLKVVAEGIDREGQLEPLREMGCDEIQGFLISPAVSADDFVVFLPPPSSRDSQQDGLLPAALKPVGSGSSPGVQE